jgi:hypothetical protein
MAFKTDGSSHHDGIKEEKEIANDRELLKEMFNLSDNFEAVHKGGTQNKADLVVKDGSLEKKISVKKKIKLSTGSYDYVNSSKALSDSKFKAVKDMVTHIASSNLTKSVARRKFSEVCHDAMINMTSQDIKDILVDHVLNKNLDIEIVLKETSSGSVYGYSFKDTPLAKSIKNHTPKFKWGRGKTSAKIVFEDADGNIHDHNLRGRLVSNNGITAMLPSSSKSSTPVFKIQQDAVHKIVDDLIKKNIATKWR